MSDDLARRRDEADALSIIFAEDFLEVLANSEWRFQYRSEEKVVASLACFLPDDYPSCSPPVLVLDGPKASRDACDRFLEGFVPGEEFGLSLCQQFFEFCKEAEVGCPSGAHHAAAEHQSLPDETQETATDVMEDNFTEAVIDLGSNFNIVKELCRSLIGSGSDASDGGGFQLCGAGIFVHGELGISVEIKDIQGIGIDIDIQSIPSLGEAEQQNGKDLRLHISADGIDSDEVFAWASKEFEEFESMNLGVSTLREKPSFGQKLLQWADAQRAAGENKYGSADGIVDGVHDIASVAGHTLTGNAAWKARLQAGETVQFRGGGNSLHPRIKSGECCKYEPVFKHGDVEEKDIVFCQIKGRYWGHMVKKKTFVGGDKVYEYTISNIRGWENGTIGLEHIYGKVIDHWK